MPDASSLIDALAFDSEERTAIEHLLCGLAPDAVEFWTGHARRRETRLGLHDALHSGLSATRKALRVRRSGVPIHAGAVQLSGGRGVMAAGRTSSGKSTLITALAVYRDGAVVGDDTVWYDGETLADIGAPVAVRSTSPFWPRVRSLWYAEEGDRMLVRPEDLGARPTSLATPATVLVFPTFDGQSEGRDYERVRATDGLCELMRSVLRPIDEHDLLALGRLVASCTIARLSYADVSTSIALVDELLAVAGEQKAAVAALVDRSYLESLGFHAHVCVLRLGDDAVIWDRSRDTLVSVYEWSAGVSMTADFGHELVALGLVRRSGQPDRG